MRPKYARGTSVTPTRTRSQLQTLLRKHGAEAVALMEDSIEIRVGFRLQGRSFLLQVPSVTQNSVFLDITHGRRVKPRGWARLRTAQVRSMSNSIAKAEERERWRAVLLLVKSKLVAVSLGLTTVEREFLADLVLPDKRRVHEMLAGGEGPFKILGSGSEP